MRASLLVVLAAVSVSCTDRPVLKTENSTGAPLWDELLTNCSTGPFSCVQDTFTSFLDRSLSDDINVTRSIAFRKNANNFSLRNARMAPTPDPEFSNFVDSVEAAENQVYGGDPSPSGVKYNVFGLGEVLYNRGVSYLMNHDVQLSLPEFFGGGTIHIRPKSLDEEGALVRFRYDNPEDEPDTDLQPTGRILLKRIKKFFSKKLLTSFLAALLIIALLKVKLLFFLPIFLGVGTAKKILLKVLLFIFPALTHLFKLCAYYHQQHHHKYHHHHHQVAHHHHHIPVPVASHTPPPYHELPEYLEHPPNNIHRNDIQDVDLPAWGIEHNEDEYVAYNSRRKYQNTRFDDLKYQDSLNVPPNINKSPPSVQSTNVLALGGVWDPFYSPILTRLDDVFAQLGFHDEGCRERLVCSMYKAPDRFSPHSNLVSAQLSRDPAELQKPGYSNAAVMRFYRYVQAARDGQDFKNCLSLYPHCTIITEK